MNQPQIPQQGNWEQNAILMMVENMQNELKLERRWRRILVVLRLSGFIVMLGGLLFAFLHKPIAERSHTAIVKVIGEIAAGRQADASRLIPALRKAFENEHSQGVIIAINSPGGSPVQASRIYQEVKRLRAEHPEKPVYAVIDDIGASGGYYIATAADDIYADEASMVGSIGVISSGFGFTELMDKMGIERRTITAGKNKAMMDPYSPLDKDIRSYWKSLLNETHGQFIARVKEGRGDRLAEDDSLFSGLIWNGAQAVDLGLIDGLGSAHTVAADIVGEDTLLDYSPPIDFMTRMTGNAVAAVSSRINEVISQSVQF